MALSRDKYVPNTTENVEKLVRKVLYEKNIVTTTLPICLPVPLQFSFKNAK